MLWSWFEALGTIYEKHKIDGSLVVSGYVVYLEGGRGGLVGVFCGFYIGSIFHVEGFGWVEHLFGGFIAKVGSCLNPSNV
jgi:hypothetical protein